MKKLIWICAAVILIALVIAFVLPSGGPKPSPWLTFPDGSSARIVAVTYGTNHIIGSPLGHVLAHLPDAVQEFVPTLFHQTTTVEPAVVLWLEYRSGHVVSMMPNPAGNFYVCLADGSGIVSGEKSSRAGYFGNLGMVAAEFKTVPRRDANLRLNFFGMPPSFRGQLTNVLEFPNPLYRQYPEWQPETLPGTKTVGDVEVTLAGIHTGYSTSNSFGVMPRRPRGFEVIYPTNHADGEMATVLDLRIRSLTDSIQTWGAKSVEISDATGNHLRADLNPPGIEGATTWKFYPSLWPAEKAWKLKIELAQTGNFGPESLVTFKNVQLATVNSFNPPGMTTNFNGVTISLASRFLPVGSVAVPLKPMAITNSIVSATFAITNSILPQGIRMDLYRIIFDDGSTNVGYSSGSSETWRNVSLNTLPPGVKAADITFAVHRTRFVEFTVHPDPPPTSTNR